VDERPWYFHYSIRLLDSEEKVVSPTAKGQAVLDARAQSIGTGVVIGVSVQDILPADAEVAELNLSLLYQIEARKSYSVKIMRSDGLPAKDAAGEQIDPELACTLAIDGSRP
jgi:hypothetical protein